MNTKRKIVIIVLVVMVAVIAWGTIDFSGQEAQIAPYTQQEYPSFDVDYIEAEIPEDAVLKKVTLNDFEGLPFETNKCYIEVTHGWNKVTIKFWTEISGMVFYTEQEVDEFYFESKRRHTRLARIKRIDDTYTQIGGGIVKVNVITKSLVAFY